MKKQIILPAVVMLALGSFIATLPTTGAFAQAANAPAANAPAAAPDQRPHRDFAAFLDRRIGHMKSELKITPAQEPLFNAWAQTLRANATERQKTFADLRGTRAQHRSAVDRLETSVKLTQLRVTQEQRTLAAFKPLYASLSADQQKIADDMMAPHRFGHRRM